MHEKQLMLISAKLIVRPRRENKSDDREKRVGNFLGYIRTQYSQHLCGTIMKG